MNAKRTVHRTLATAATVTVVVALGTAGNAAADTPPWSPPDIGSIEDLSLPTFPEITIPDDLDDFTLPEIPEVTPDDVDDETLPTLPDDPELAPCGAVDMAAFGVTMVDNGDGTAFVQVGYYDGEDACDAPVSISSYATNVDQSEQALLASAGTTIDELEAAALGDGWYETDIALDPCFSQVVVAVEDEKVAVEMFGLGCSISVAKDFEGDPWNAGITLVHEAGWTPDHVLDVSSDDLVVWDELPSGNYTVFEYMGAVDGTTISIDGGAAAPHAGEPVPVEVGQSVVVFNPDVTLDLTAEIPDETDPTVPEDTDPTIPEDTDPTVPEDTDPQVPGGELPKTGSNATGTMAAGALAAGLLGLGCTAIARRRR